MSRDRIIALLLLAVIAIATTVSGCSVIEPTIEPDLGSEGTSEISFGSSVDWSTRGEVIDGIGGTDGISEIALLTYFVEGKEWDDVTDTNDLGSFFSATSPDWITLAADANGDLSYISEAQGGVRYWPTGEGQYLNFFALYPTSEFAISYDEDSGKPQFDYTLSPWAQDNEDVVFDAQFDLQASASEGDDGKVTFDLEHLLTRLSISVQLSGQATDLGVFYDEDGTTQTEDSNEYRVNGLTFYNLYDGATLDIAENGTATWIVEKDNDNTIELTATQGYSIQAIPPVDRTELEEGVEYADPLKSTIEFDPSYYIDNDEDDLYDPYIAYTDVMAKGKAIFVLPQSLGSVRKASTDEGGDGGSTAPSVQIRIRRSYKANSTSTTYEELMYASEAVEIPASTTSGCWEAGQWNNLCFTFDLDNLDKYDTPLTLFSNVYEWSDVDVDVSVSQNVYIYASDNLIEVDDIDATTADMCFYTNYQYDLRRHKRKVELDGETYNEASGFSFYTAYANGTDISSTPYDPIIMYEDKEYTYTYKTNAAGDGYDLYLTSENGEEIFIEQKDGIADLSTFETQRDEDIDGDGIDDELWWMDFKIKPYSTEGLSDDDLALYSAYDFTYSVAKTTRGAAGLYVNSSIETSATGINKSEEDSVYILRLDINPSHLMKEGGVNGFAVAGTDEYGYFYGKIGTEMISNGGGVITNKFFITLQKRLTAAT